MSTDIEVEDASGNLMKLRDVDGRYLVPSALAADWRDMKNLQVRSDDVFICSYPKSGFHLVWEITTMLRSGEASYNKEVMELNILDFIPRDYAESKPSPRTLTTHRYPEEMPVQVCQRQCKIVYLLRDPRDICVSYHNHLSLLKNLDYDGELNDFAPLFASGKVPFNSWPQHIQKWSDFRDSFPDHPFHIVHFEDLINNPVEQIRRLATFLDLNVSDELVQGISEKTRFKPMKEAKEKMHNPVLPYFKNEKEIMYRKGVVGDWKNCLSDKRRREIDDAIRCGLEHTDYTSLMSEGRYPCTSERVPET